MPRQESRPRSRTPSRAAEGVRHGPARPARGVRQGPRSGRPRPGTAGRRHTEEAQDRRGIDTIEGWNPVLEALRAGRPISKVMIAQDVGRHSGVAEVLGRAEEAGIVIERVERRVIDRLSPTKMSQGVLAMTAAKAYANLDGILAAAQKKGEAPLLVLLDGIVDPQNLGAVIRTAEAAGVHGLVIPERRAVGLTAAVARASAGAVEYLPVARVTNMANTITRLGQDNVWSVGIDPAATQDYTSVDYRQPTALVIGAEGKGISRLIKERCDLLVSIPMRGRVASLNASVAAALVMYEALRQRHPPHSEKSPEVENKAGHGGLV